MRNNAVIFWMFISFHFASREKEIRNGILKIVDKSPFMFCRIVQGRCNKSQKAKSVIIVECNKPLIFATRTWYYLSPLNPAVGLNPIYLFAEIIAHDLISITGGYANFNLHRFWFIFTGTRADQISSFKRGKIKFKDVRKRIYNLNFISLTLGIEFTHSIQIVVVMMAKGRKYYWLLSTHS